MSLAGLIAAIYARYSTDEQRPTSIDDQVRRCRETAAKEGLAVAENFVFKDSAISGTEKGRTKRVEFQRLLDAIEARLVDVLFIDDVSRATRDYLEGAKLMAIVEKSGLRVVTSDGLDTAQPNWKTLWQIKLMTAGMQVENTAMQVVRGMLGQLERGYQIAQPPFGYRGVRVKAEDGRELGTHWVIEEKEAGLIRKMYAWRKSGMSVAKIASELNSLGVLSPCYRRCKKGIYWRPATVHRILANPIYKGVFIWNGSNFTKAKANRTRKPVKEIEFARPLLGFISEELWADCNQPKTNIVVRNGAKNSLAGVVRCGVCQALLSLNKVKNSCSVHCPQCEQANRVGGHHDFIGYSSLAAANLALEWCLREVFTGDVLKEFHARLQARLLEGPVKEEADLKQRLAELDSSIKRMKRFVLETDVSDELFKDELIAALAEQKSKRCQLAALQSRKTCDVEGTVATQSAIDPLGLIQRLIDGEPEKYKVRATLRRLISKFEFVARPDKYVSVYELTFIPGVGVAEVSETEVIDDTGVSFRVTVSTTARRPVVWVVKGERI
jgi:DNA invertase Pin-like site-specific DNA recombinase